MLSNTMKDYNGQTKLTTRTIDKVNEYKSLISGLQIEEIKTDTN